MQLNYTVLVTLLIAFVIPSCNSAYLKVRGNLENGIATENVHIFDKIKSVDKEVIDQNKKGDVQAGSGLGKDVQATNSVSSENQDSSKLVGSNDDGNKQNKPIDSVSDKAGDSTAKAKEGLENKPEKGGTEPGTKGDFRGEECDSSSNSCSIDDKALVACLRVPGDESPNLSLLVQNKGKGTVTVTISAPAFVHLEPNQIELPGKESKKVTVSIGKKAAGSTMVLKAGNGNCTLDFKNLITQGTLKDHVSNSQIAVINFLKSTSITWVLLLAAFVVIALLGTVLSLWRKRVADNKPKYEKLEVELPVSSGSKMVSASNDGWDESWDDSWDDEEAPKTPSMVPSSSLSQGIVTPRRIIKDGWKD